MVEGDQIYGDGVNIAARLESLADPDGICVSDTVYAQIKNKLALGYTDIGKQRVKNIAEPVRVFRVTAEAGASAPGFDELASTNICAARRALACRSRDNYWHDCAGAASVAATAGAVCVYSAGATPGSFLARQTLYCRAALCQHKQRSNTKLFQ
jgi:hypothetical protein